MVVALTVCVTTLHTGISLVVVRTNLMEQPINNDMVLSHDDGSLFVLPISVLAAAQKQSHYDCKYLSGHKILLLRIYLQFGQYPIALLG